MKRLILMRHAKSGWSDLGASDHERSLNARGEKNAIAVGNWLREHNLEPDHILCSDATRTQETFAHLNLTSVENTLTSDLYLAEADVMARTLKKQIGDCILMVAHNPGTAFLAAALVQEKPEHYAFDTYPTCATLVVDFKIEKWYELAMGTGTAAHFIVPRDLKE